MMTRRIQVLLVGLVAISALEHSAWQTTQAEAKLRADRLAHVQPKSTVQTKTKVQPPIQLNAKAKPTPTTRSLTPVH